MFSAMLCVNRNITMDDTQTAGRGFRDFIVLSRLPATKSSRKLLLGGVAETRTQHFIKHSTWCTVDNRLCVIHERFTYRGPKILSINYAFGRPFETFFASTENESGPYNCCGIRSVNDIHTSVIKYNIYNTLPNINGNTAVIDDVYIFDVHT